MRILSIDLETLGREPGCVIASVGMARTDGDEVVDSTVVKPSIQEQLDIGMHVGADTIEWWMRQTDSARVATFTGGADRRSINDTLDAIDEYYDGCAFVTGYGAMFDVSILEYLYRVCDRGTPWRYTEILCLRTMCMMTGTKVDRSEGTHHDARDDAIAQGRAMIECIGKIGG